MTDRLHRLQGLLGRQQQAVQERMVGQEVGVLFEKPGREHGQMIGKSDHLHAVYATAPASILGQVRRVRITRSSPNSLAGELIS